MRWGICAAALLWLTPHAVQRAVAGGQNPAPAIADSNQVQAPASDHRLQLRSGVVDTSVALPLDEGALAAGAGDGRLIVQLAGPMTPERRAALEQLGVAIGDYLPTHAFVLKLNGVAPRDVVTLPFVRWASPVRTEWKLDPDIGRRALTDPSRQQLAAQGTVQVVATLYAKENVEPVLAQFASAGANILGQTRSGDQWLIDATVPIDAVARLAAVSAVQFVEEAPELVLRNNTNEWIVQGNVPGQTPIWDAGLHGEGQIGGLIDGTMRESHCAFDDVEPIGPTHRKVVALRNPTSVDSHGTHTAGTLAGDSGTWNAPDLYDGIAYAAKISFSNVDPIYASPSTLNARLTDAHDDGARIHSNSWGDDGTTAYTTWCRQIDQFSYDNEEDLVLFAVTNQNFLKTPENAKNVLGIGATNDAPSQHTHCTGGTGPTADGRRKPEVYAPGCNTNSASSFSSCGTFADGGTSMACPLVTGAGLLIRQYFTEGWYPTGAPENPPLTPSGALLKAMLINSTEDMTGVAGYPSNLEGWGRLQLDATLVFPGSTINLYVEDVRNADGLTTGQQDSFTVSVINDTAPLRITLVFTEPPAAVNAGNPVINNLDLEVTGPGAVVYKGNFFSGGESVTGGPFDAKNNVERALLLAPEPGVYTVKVLGAEVNVGTQGYAVVISGDFTKDCNGNSVPDADDLLLGNSLDCNLNSIPDECEDDCDADLIPDECELADCVAPDPACADCNANLIPDECDIASAFSLDCNANGVPDDCDIASEFSPDVNGDAIPDECCTPTAAPATEPVVVLKNRYISLLPGNDGIVCALRLQMTANVRFGDSVGLQKWIGPPDPLTGVARLQCTPEYRDWGAGSAVVHVGDVDLSPGAAVSVRAIAQNCGLTEELSYSAAFTGTTADLWGDCVGTFTGSGWSAPNFIVNFFDVQAALIGFQALPTAPAMVRVDIEGELPNAVVNIADVFQIVRAFQGVTYPFAGPAACTP